MSKSEWVKTGKEITKGVLGKGVLGGPYMEQAEESSKEKQKYLTLPWGLDKLEEILKNEMGRESHGDKIHSVFTRFKKELK